MGMSWYRKIDRYIQHSYGKLATSYSCSIFRGDSLETGRSSDHNSKLTVPQSQWTTHLNTWLTSNLFTSPRLRLLSTSIHSPAKYKKKTEDDVYLLKHERTRWSALMYLPCGRLFPSYNCPPESGQTSCFVPSIDVKETNDSVGCIRQKVGWTLKHTSLRHHFPDHMNI